MRDRRLHDSGRGQPAEYRLAREQPTRFLVAPSHVDPDYERVVTRSLRFAIVEKLGLAGEIATDEAD